MNDAGTVNDQVTDSVNSVTTLISGQSPAQAFAMLDTVMVETMGMAMYNAVNRQQNSAMVSSAAVTAACARMLSAYPMVTPPAPPLPPTILPLPGPPPSAPPAVVVETAFSQGTEAITTLKAVVGANNTVAKQAQADLEDLARQAGS